MIPTLSCRIRQQNAREVNGYHNPDLMRLPERRAKYQIASLPQVDAP